MMAVMPAARPPAQTSRFSDRAIIDAIRRTWGFDALRPLQAEAIRAVLDRRDSLVVMPTGGGKSLCYQAPPLLTGELTVVVSPLISLMKDQVDGLRLNGYPAAALHGNLSPAESRQVWDRLQAGALRLLFVAPERLLTEGFLSTLQRLRIGTFAIDEAHCISQWGHDFRPEYRRIALLRDRFPGATFHAYTATATPRVREDIAAQLRLQDHVELVGRFDRPNLTYRILPRVRLDKQLVETLSRHQGGESGGGGGGQASIVYCISRRETEAIAAMLTRHGIEAEAYHAGLTPEKRREVQEAFASERLNVVVATVAFGMGIDRSDVRCVVHAAMPKSIEHYQQETGRAGRDGLPAECVLFYSAADVQQWKRLIEASAGEIEVVDEESLERARAVVRAQLELLGHVHRLCSGARCRHRALSEYFGQAYEPPGGGVDGCGACDVCLGELETAPDSQVVAQKIVSCVARASLSSGGMGFGVAHIVDVLRGKANAKIVERRHNELSTFGLLWDVPRETLISYVNQLIDEGVLERTQDQYPVLRLTAASAELLRGRREVRLISPRRPAGEDGWVGAGARRGATPKEASRPLTPEERGLFESLRALRRQVAEELAVPPYVVFSDATLEEMARVRPGAEESFVSIRGIGTAKLTQFGERFIDHVRSYCDRNGLELDASPGSRPRGAGSGRGERVTRPGAPAPGYGLFEEGASIEQVAAKLGRAESTVVEYLLRYIRDRRPASVAAWVPPEVYAMVERAAGEVGALLLRPIFERLGGKVSYETIKIVLAHLEATQPAE